MDASSSSLILLVTLLLFTGFVKILTVLSICRYGLGLIGFEFGVVCLAVALGISLFLCPPELTALGFPDVMLFRSQTTQPEAVRDALVPFMKRRLDPGIAKHFVEGSKDGEGQAKSEPASIQMSLRTLVPGFLLSELKSAFQIGCLLLIPLVLIDLLSAHLLALLGVQSLTAHAVSLPLKIIVFIAAGGWGALGSKLMGVD